MKGQWIGSYSGTTQGSMIVNVDDRGDHFQGAAHLFEQDPKFPHAIAFFQTKDRATPFSFRTDEIHAFDPETKFVSPWNVVKKHYASDVTFSQYADAEGTWNDCQLQLAWNTDSGASGSAVLTRSQADQPSKLVPLERTWSTYKEYLSTLRDQRYLFRGQRKPWRLRTSFHRRGRADLSRFIREDIPMLHKHLSARTKHVFDLNVGDQTGAFYNLIQHHGYPTPLLDWTYSPYVAAFFAYRRILSKDAGDASSNDKVRIHIFDQQNWRKDQPQILQVLSPRLHLTVGEFIAIENERMIPQQSASTVTNIDDIETYVKTVEATTGKVYLSAIDLPVNERNQVIRELKYMGITAGSLFPGLDGACEELTERNFEP